MIKIERKQRNFANGSDKKGAPFFNFVAYEDDLRHLKKLNQKFPENMRIYTVCLS